MSQIKEIGLSWITVSDMQRTKKMFADIFGFVVYEENPQFGWCEMMLAHKGNQSTSEVVKLFGYTIYQKGIEQKNKKPTTIGLCQSTHAALDINNDPNQMNNKPGQNAVMTFVVESIDKTVALLKIHNMNCTQVTELPNRFRCVTFFDFDNNKMQLYQFFN